MTEAELFREEKKSLTTHRELPWIEARGDAKPFQHCTTPISTETMAKYYKSIYQGDE